MAGYGRLEHHVARTFQKGSFGQEDLRRQAPVGTRTAPADR